MTDRSIVNTDHARSQDQINALEKIRSNKECPFCDKDYLKKEHKKPILWEGEFWLVTENRWPYEGAKEHLLLIHKNHIAHANEISDQAWRELHQATIRIAEGRAIHGGTLIMRFGDNRYNGATVTHLHAQLVCGDPDKPDRKPVLTRVG